MDKGYETQCDIGSLTELADVLLVAEGQELPAHSQILAVYSTFFRNLCLDQQTADATKSVKLATKGKRKVLPLGEAVSAKDVKHLLVWLDETNRSAISRKVRENAVTSQSQAFKKPLW